MLVWSLRPAKDVRLKPKLLIKVHMRQRNGEHPALICASRRIIPQGCRSAKGAHILCSHYLKDQISHKIAVRYHILLRPKYGTWTASPLCKSAQSLRYTRCQGFMNQRFSWCWDARLLEVLGQPILRCGVPSRVLLCRPCVISFRLVSAILSGTPCGIPTLGCQICICYIHMHIYIHTHIYIYICIHTCAYTNMYIRIYVIPTSGPKASN